MYAGGVIMNKRRFDALPPDVQTIFRDVGAEYAERFARLEGDTAAALEERMKAAGATVPALAPAERKRWAGALPDIGRIGANDLETKQKLPAHAVLKDYMEPRGGRRRSAARLVPIDGGDGAGRRGRRRRPARRRTACTAARCRSAFTTSPAR